MHIIQNLLPVSIELNSNGVSTKKSRLCEVGGVPIIVAKLNRPLFGFEIMVTCLLGQL